MHVAAAFALASLAALTAACSPTAEEDAAADGESAILAAGPEAEIAELGVDELPAGVRDAALLAVPGLTVTGAERKARDGMVFYDVEGTRPDGGEVELDMLEEAGGYRVVEVQRDLAWDAVPADARAAAEGAPDMFVPARVIESRQEDGTVIYELFAAGKPDEPAAEIAVKDGKAEMLTERWKY